MWYAVSVFLKCVHVSKPEENVLWEQSIILINASDPETATRQAQLKADPKSRYQVDSGITAEWVFHGIDMCYEIDCEVLETGVEVFSRFLTNADVENLCKPISDL